MASFASQSPLYPSVATSSNNNTTPIESYDERSAISLNSRPTMIERLVKTFGFGGSAQVSDTDNSTSNTDQRFIVIADGADEEFSEIQVRPLSYAEMAARGTGGMAKAATVGGIEVPLSAVYGEQKYHETEDNEEEFLGDDCSNQQRSLEESLSDLSSVDIDNNASVAPSVKAEYLQGYRVDTLEKKFLQSHGHKKGKKRASPLIRLVQKPL